MDTADTSGPAGPDQDDGVVPGRRRAAQVAARWVLLAVVVTGFALAVGDQWSEVRDSLGTLPAWALACGFLLVAVGLLGTWWGWRSALTGLGSPIPARQSARVFFVGQLGKYVPGSVWPVVVQMRLGREFGVPRSRIGIAFAVTLGVGVATGLVIGLLVLPALLAGPDSGYAWILALTVPALVALHPAVLNRALSAGLRLAHRPVPDRLLTAGSMTRVIAGNLIFWVAAGLHVWLLTLALGADPLAALPVSVGGFALAFVVGPLLVVLPAGAGVREAVMTVTLASVLPVADAVAVALMSRALLMAADGLTAAGAVLVARDGDARSQKGQVTGAR